MECVERERGGDDESEQKRSAEPIDDGGSCGIERCRCMGNRSVGEPLKGKELDILGIQVRSPQGIIHPSSR